MYLLYSYLHDRQGAAILPRQHLRYVRGHACRPAGRAGRADHSARAGLHQGLVDTDDRIPALSADDISHHVVV